MTNMSDAWFKHAMDNLDFTARLREIKEEKDHPATCICDDCNIWWSIRCTPANCIYSLELPERAESKKQ